MTYRWNMSYESDTTPVRTMRGEVEATDLEQAISKGLFRAKRPKGKFRSLVIVVEEIVETPAE